MEQLRLYIHIPFCVKKCDYCDFLSGAYDVRTQKMYTQALCIELAYMSLQFKNSQISSIYIGGGTPSWLDASDMEAILKVVFRSFRVAKNAEISIECNPGTLTNEKLKTYKEIGINRISIGMQSANDAELKLLGRIHTNDRFLTTYENVRRAGFDNVNIDIMTGLPHQTPELLQRSLNQVATLRPEHVSAYSLIIEEGTPFYERYKFDAVKQHAGMPTEELPSDELNYELYRQAIDFLKTKGYTRYEISNYAKEGRYCQHNVGYWDRDEYLGVGVGAASLLRTGLGQRTMTMDHRTSNITDVYDYITIADRLSKDQLEINKLDETNSIYSPFWVTDEAIKRSDAMAEFMYLGLRMCDGVSRDDFYNMFGCQIDGVYKDTLESLKAQGFIDMTQGRIWLTNVGMDISNQVLGCFLID